MLYCAIHFFTDTGHAVWKAGRRSLRAIDPWSEMRFVWPAGPACYMRAVCSIN
jgi:hypothetical protein